MVGRGLPWDCVGVEGVEELKGRKSKGKKLNAITPFYAQGEMQIQAMWWCIRYRLRHAVQIGWLLRMGVTLLGSDTLNSLSPYVAAGVENNLLMLHLSCRCRHH